MGTLESLRIGRRPTQQGVVLGFVALLTAVLVLGPLTVLAFTSVTPTDAAGVTGFGFENFFKAFGANDTLGLVSNTLKYAFGAVTVGLIVATAIAALTERTDIPGRQVIRMVMFATMALPPLMLAFGWVLLLNPNNGAIFVWLRDLVGMQEAPFSVYSLQAMIGITGIGLVPTMYVMISGVVRNMDARLETAALTSGAGKFNVFRHITFPLLSPGLVSVAIYLLMLAVQFIDIPLAIGLTARVPLFSTRIYLLEAPEAGAADHGLAAAFGVILLLVALFLISLYQRVTRQSERYQVVSGKGYRPRRMSLGKARYVALAFVCLYFVVMMMPVGILLWASLVPFYQVPSFELMARISLDNYAALGRDSLVKLAISNTVVLVLSSATLTMSLGSIIAWFATRTRMRLGKGVETLAFGALAIPSIVMATSLRLLYVRSPLYGTVLLLIIGHVAVYLPFATRTMGAVLLQINEELERAAMISGASWFTTLRRVLLPILWPQLLDGWLWVMAHSLRDLTIPLVLMSGSNVVMSSALWRMWNLPNITGASALGILMILFSIALVVPVQIHLHRRENVQTGL